MSIEKGTAFIDPFSTATDPAFGDLTDDIMVTGSVDINTVGVYVLTYTITNQYGKSSAVTRRINVMPKVAAPMITLSGNSSIKLESGTPYTELGYQAKDDIDGDLTSKVVVDYGGLDIANPKAGTYTITYTVINSFGKTASVTRAVVVKDKEESGKPKPPVKPNGSKSAPVTGDYSENTLLLLAISASALGIIAKKKKYS